MQGVRVSGVPSFSLQSLGPSGGTGVVLETRADQKVASWDGKAGSRTWILQPPFLTSLGHISLERRPFIIGLCGQVRREA